MLDLVPTPTITPGPNDTVEYGMYCLDCIDALHCLESESIDLIITSPPYNLGSRYAGSPSKYEMGKFRRKIQYGAYNDFLPEDEYREWQQTILRECWRVIKPTGAIYYNHRPRIQQNVCLHRFNLIPEEVTIRQVIVWRRPKGHNFNGSFFVPSYEWIFLLAKPKYMLTKGSPGWGDVWEIQPTTARQNNDHAAAFPLAIPLRAIRASRNVDLVLDIFVGSGVTALAAKQEGKRWIGFDNDLEAILKARERVRSEEFSLPSFTEQVSMMID